MNRSEAVRAYLRQHYPCQRLPHGARVKVAAELGVSASLVYLICRTEDYRKFRAPAKPCMDCGQRARLTPSRFCAQCQQFPFTCACCGTAFTLSRTDLSHARWFAKSRGCDFGRYCSRQCSAAAMGEQNRGRRRATAQQKALAVSQPASATNQA